MVFFNFLSKNHSIFVFILKVCLVKHVHEKYYMDSSRVDQPQVSDSTFII